MILKLSVGEAVQISHILKMRFHRQKRHDHSALFLVLWSEWQTQSMQDGFILSASGGGEERKGTLPLVSMHKIIDGKETCKNKKTVGEKLI